MGSSLNIILFGETSVGKSSVINLIAGRPIVKTSPDVQGCTMSFRPYLFNVVHRGYHIWETVGLEEPEMGVNGYLPAIEQACELIHHLNSRGGVDLLLFCIHGNRISETTQSNYQLFYEVLCRSKIPIALVITHLERETSMEGWWVREEESLERYGIKAAGHACVTGLPTHSKFPESRSNIMKLLEGHNGDGRFNMPPESWLVEFLRHFGLFGPLKGVPKRKDIVKVLTKRCRLDQKIAEELAYKLNGEVVGGESLEKVTGFKGHSRIVDASPNGTNVATGSGGTTASAWSLSTGARLLVPFHRLNSVVAAKFSPDGRLVATATTKSDCFRIYDSQDGCLLVEFPIRVCASGNKSLAWTADGRQLFTLSSDGNINCLDVSTGSCLSKWSTHTKNRPDCIALAKNGKFVVTAGNSLILFWDIKTHKQIGSVVAPMDYITMDISSNCILVAAGDGKMNLWCLCDILPSAYCKDSSEDEESYQGNKNRPVTTRGHSGEIVISGKATTQLRDKLANHKHAAIPEKDHLNETISLLRKDLRVQEINSKHKINQLEETIRDLQTQLADSQRSEITARDRLNDTITSLLTHFQNQQTSPVNSVIWILRAHEKKLHCEALYSEGHIVEAALSLLECAVNQGAEADKLFKDWLPKFTGLCIMSLEKIGDESSAAGKNDEALTAYSTALSLGPSNSNDILAKWANVVVLHVPVNEAFSSANKFDFPRFFIYRAICEALERKSRVNEAIAYLQRMQDESAGHTDISSEQVQWVVDFRRRCMIRSEGLGDSAIISKRYSEAIQLFSTALSLHPGDSMEILLKRGKALISLGLWEKALNDADEAINLEPSSHWGHEIRHAALHGANRFSEAVEAFDVMLQKLKQSPDGDVRELGHQYVDARPNIRHIVASTIRLMPRILIDTTTGRLCGKSQQAELFKTLPIYLELVSSMTRELDDARIWSAAKKFYRYVMFSHTWEDGEPLLQLVEHTTVYELEVSSANAKLKTFCSLARSLGFRWAWSDTCCVDKVNTVVLQESLVAMFTWYRNSALTLVYLRGVSSKSREPGGLRDSIWNTRGWTYQEYVAAETIQFYADDWKPYLGLTLPNHKESPIVLTEMEQVSHISTQELAVLRPGLDRVREKLYMASTRHTTLTEDAAYSLLGIFNAAIPVIYGEGNRAIGRLLEYILTGSGDVTILAWTGCTSSYNSCLPMDLSVYNPLVPPHIPRPMDSTEMGRMVEQLRTSLSDLSLATTLYDRLCELPAPYLAASRLRLPGIVFRLTELTRVFKSNSHMYCAATSTFGDVEIKTLDDLSKITDLYLVHPWIRPLLDQEFAEGAAELDRTTQALRFIARLRQPFGALLFKAVSRVEYRRVAADTLVMVQIREGWLTELVENVRTIEVQ